MERRITQASLVVVVLWFCGMPLLAHHSFGAEYDANTPITLTGVVTKIEWTNPHSHLYLDVRDDKGSLVNWKFEGYGPGVLFRNDWKKDVTVKAGDTITVFGWRARDGGNWAHSREITLPDGSKRLFGPPAGTGEGGNTPAVEVR